METDFYNRWTRVLLISFGVVVLLGTIMRYKIAFEFPFLDQQNIQRAHSHFAFSGWVGQALFVFIFRQLEAHRYFEINRIVKRLLLIHYVLAIGMLFSFAFQGYDTISIVFSTLTVFVEWVMAVYIFSITKTFRQAGGWIDWIKGGLVFMILSSAGTAVLVYMITSHHFDQHGYLASIYWYLHFHYNGWFFMGCIGLLLSLFDYSPDMPKLKRVFYGLFFSCAPAYLLSVLWLKLHPVLFVVCVIAAVVQLIAWFQLLQVIRKSMVQKSLPDKKIVSAILLLVAIAGSSKFLLQLGSNIPSVSKLAFGFHSVVIAYLHLVLLCMVSVLLLTYPLIAGWLKLNHAGMRLFLFIVGGIYVNEIFLGAQAVTSLVYIAIPYINEMLFGIAVLILGLVVSYIGRVYGQHRVELNGH